MQPSADSILSAALNLPEDQRLTLVSRLLESMPADGPTIAVEDPSLSEELQRRFADREGAVCWRQLRDEG